MRKALRKFDEVIFISGKAQKTELYLSIMSIFVTSYELKRVSSNA